MIIALMGHDGVGKTSIAIELKKKLHQLGLESEYRRGVQYTVLGAITNLFFGEHNVENTRTTFSKGKKKSIFIIWPFLVFFDCMITSIILWLFSKQKIVVLDRYFYDFLISFEYLGYSNRLIKRLFLTLPRPNFAVILLIPPQVAYERNKITHDMNIKYYIEQRKRYIRLANELKIKMINSNRPLNDTMNEILYSLQFFL